MKKTISAAARLTLWNRVIRPASSSRHHATLPVLTVLALLHAFNVHAQAPVLRRGYDANVSGATLSETTLNTSTVSSGSFGLAFSLPVDDNIMAQPLYVPNVTINGSSHNVLYVATMSDSLYAFDADVGGAPLWQFNLAAFENAKPLPLAQFSSSGNLIGNLGILSTPVIDLSTNTLYAVAGTEENGTLVYRLHAVDITTGTPRTGSGVVISGMYKTMTFNARYEWQRVSLVLAGNNVVFGFGAMESEGTAHLYSGWVMAYDKGTLAQTGIFATETIGNGGGGVWQSGRPPAVDSSGYVYVFTGNGYSGMGYDGVNNFSESALKLDPTHGLSLVDWFTPAAWAALDSSDTDLSSAGPLLVPGTSLLVGGGKAAVVYVLNTGGLGKETANDSGAVQKIPLPAGTGNRGGPVYWQRSAANGGPLLFDWASQDQLRACPFNGSTFATTPSALGNVISQIYPGGILALSANGDTPGSGVLWATVSMSGNADDHPPTPGELYAFDAGNVATQLWNSNMNAARDAPGNFAKFVPPLVANGKVYVATWSKQVAVYGMLGPPAATPAFSPAPGTYSTTQSVALSDSTPGASIYYTTDGTTPHTSSTLYTGSPIAVGSSMTINAIAVGGGFSISAVASGAYVINFPPAATPAFSAAPGTYSTTQLVALSDTTAGASIYYTTDGTTPTTSSNLYSPGTPIPVSSSVTINAIAVASGFSTSAVASGAYVITTGTTIVVPLSGSATVVGIANYGSPVPSRGLDGNGNAYAEALLGSSLTWIGNTYSFGSADIADAISAITLPLPATNGTILSLLGTAVNGNRPNQVFTVKYTDGTSTSFTQSVSDWFTPQNYPGETTVLTMAYRITPTGTLNKQTYYLYGYSFVLNPAKTVASLTLPNTLAVRVLAVDVSGSTSPVAAAPTFGPAPGTYTTTQSVALSDNTAGASIYYTTDGTTPTASSNLYSPGTPIPVSSSVTINAIAVASGFSTSAVANGTYVIHTGTTIVVPLSGSATVVGIANNGSPVPGRGLDGNGNAYSETLLGASLNWNGNTYSFGSADIADAVTDITLPLPAGNYTTLSLLGTAVNGNRPSQVFTVNYNDGTSTSFTQSVSDWFTPQNYPGESTALTMAYRVTSTGTLNNQTFYLYGYSFTLNPAKTVASVTLPKILGVRVLAVDLN